MANSLYQATVKHLEAVLPPRVASQSLHEGLKQLQKTPESVTADDLEKILKGQVYRRLQVALSADKAKETIQGLLERLRSAPAVDATPKVDLKTQAREISKLKESLKPFNLYFEWPETQKLRAQLQLLEAEQSAGRDAHELVGEAKAQLGVLEQKLEGQLVTQARELSELSEALEQVKSLGGAKVRRLENLLGQIESAQQTRQSAAGEVERARKIATDLRKLIASAVLEAAETEASETGAGSAKPTATAAQANSADASDSTAHTAKVSEELKRLDLESDAHELSRLTGEFANLFLFEPALSEHLEQAKATLAAQTPLGERLEELRNTFAQAQVTLREALRTEFSSIAAHMDTLEGADANELKTALPVTLSVLETTLPARADVQRVRDLYGLLNTDETDDPERSAQLAQMHRLEREAAPYLELDDDDALQLALLLDASRTQLEVGREADELEQAWPLLEEVRSVVAQRAATFEPRLDAALETFKPIASLNTDETLSVKRTLHHLDKQREAFQRVTPGMQAQLSAALSEAETTLEELQNVWEATRAVAGQLVSDNAFDDILGIFGTPTPEAKDETKTQTEPVEEVSVAKTTIEDAQLSAWLETYTQIQGVGGAALFLTQGHVASGALGVFPPPFHKAVKTLERDLDKLGDGLALGRPSIFTLELSGQTVITAWPNAHSYLSLVVTTPSTLNTTLKKLRGELPELRDLLHSLHGPTHAP